MASYSTSFVVNTADLQKILDQIKIAEAGGPNGENLVNAIGQDATLLPIGLRTVDGSFNHLLPGQELAGAADVLFPRLLTADYLNDADGDTITLPGVGAPTITRTDYDPTLVTPTGTHSVVDADPRIISNLIVDQTITNRAALEAALVLAESTNPSGDADRLLAAILTQNEANDAVSAAQAALTAAEAALDAAVAAYTPGNIAAIDAIQDAAFALTEAEAAFAHASTVAVNPAAAFAALAVELGLSISNDGSIAIEHRSPDIGLSPANSGWMTLFGQFFDHGLDLVTKGGNGTVYIPLMKDDPLYDFGADGVNGSDADDGFGLDGQLGTLDDSPNFMALTRSTPFVDPVTGLPTEAQNTTTPFIDQNQTYTSHASHQVFLREYKFDGNGDAVNTGKLLNGVNGGIANWAEVKAQALTMLGIELTDFDVNDVPLLKTDIYGKFIPGANGFAQYAIPDGLGGVTYVEANGGPLPGNAVRTGHAFLNDIAHHAAPGTYRDAFGVLHAQTADTDAGVTDDHDPTTYDNEMLDAHFITGDGRGNENIGLTAVHTIFHSEHNRLVDANKATILATGDKTFINEWLLTDLGPADAIPTTPAAIDALNWDGERMFQAARFVTEMQYQHLVFEEFARRVQPNVDPFIFTNSADLDPAIVAEFAHAVYRFGHSQLTDTVDRLTNDLELVGATTEQVGLIEAFLNPQMFTNSASVLNGVSDEEAAGAIIRGMSRQTGNELDEFIVEALRNNLVGLPLDLAALNIARGRETGVPTLNDARAEIYAMTGAVDVKPYTSWIDFAQHLKHPLSIVNFIAAYGTHDTITSATTLEGKRDAASALVLGGVGSPADRLAFLNGTDAYAGGAITGAAGSHGGLNKVDLWVGGLAEELNEFGGMLGSTFNYIFEYQMEHLQNGDRFYYLSRTQGMNLLNLLEPNNFSDMIMRNTDLGDLHATHLPALIMSVPDMILELDTLVAQEDYNPDDPLSKDPTHADPFLQALDPKVVRVQGIERVGELDAELQPIYDGGILKFSGGEHVVLGGTEGKDFLYGDKGIDTLWGDAGDDYLNAGMESDNVYGGTGDDIIEDPFGDDFLRGEAGDDVIVADLGLDLLFGGEGQDFIMGVTDTKEVFAGVGNDFVLGGSAPDVLMGNEGDDWIEGGEGFDGLSGGNSELFFNSIVDGHDILNGQGNDTDYDGENGDDIMVQGAGIQRSNGMDGFDWAIHKGDAVGADSDLGIRVFDARQALILRDRFDSVEGLSGWKHDDVLTGANRLLLGEGFVDSLTQDGVNRIDGMREFLDLAPQGGTPGTAVVFESDINTAGEIILGGAGSDVIAGNLGDDILDGDAWLNVRISVHATKDLVNSAEIFTVDSLTSIIAGTGNVAWDGKSLAELMRTGVINPGQLEGVREILNSSDGKVSVGGSTNNFATTGDVDFAVFNDIMDNYTIEGDILGNSTIEASDTDGDGFISIAHTPPAPGGGGGGNRIEDGIDKIRNFEVIQFADGVVNLAGIANSVATGTPRIIGTPAVGNVLTVVTTDDPSTPLPINEAIADADGLPPLSQITFTWQVETAPLSGIFETLTDPVTEVVITGTTFTPTTAFAIDGLRLQVIASFRDAHNFPELLVSAPSEPITGDGPVLPDPAAVLGPDLVGTDLDGDGNVLPIDSFGIVEDTLVPFTITRAALLANVSDVNTPINQLLVQNVGIRLQNVGDPSPGVFTPTLDLAGNFVSATFVPAPDFAGGVVFLFDVTDGTTVVPTEATLEVFAVNDAPTTAPVAVLGTALAGAGATVTFTEADLFGSTFFDGADFVDVDGDRLLIDPLSVTSTAGAITDDGAGNFTFVANASVNGPVTVNFTVDDGNALPNSTVVGSTTINLTNAAPTGAATLSDVGPTEGQALTVNTAAIVDANGIVPASFTVQWQVSTTGLPGSFTNLATGLSFTPAEAEVNSFIQAVVSFVDGGGTTETLIGVPAARVVGDAVDFGNGPQTFNGTAGDDLANMGDGADVASGGAGDDTINGGDGADWMDGGTGVNTMAGGAGADTYLVRNSLDSIIELPGDGQDTINANVDYVLAADARIEALNTFSSATTNVINLTGNDFSQSMAGNRAANILSGLGGNDIIWGAGGDDTIFGGAGNDSFTWNFSTSNAPVTDGRDLIDGGTNPVGGIGDRYFINGDGATAETFHVYAITAGQNPGLAGSLGTTFNPNTEIVITRTVGAVTSVIAELDNIEEITINTLNTTVNNGNGVVDGGTNINGDNIVIVGDFNSTSLNFNTITIDGNAGNDTIDISSLDSAHRIVFKSNGGNDTIIGALRPQDVIELPQGATVTNTTTGGVTTVSDGTNAVSFTSQGGLPAVTTPETTSAAVPPTSTTSTATAAVTSPHVVFVAPGNSGGVGSGDADVIMGSDGSNTLMGFGGDDNLIGGDGDDQLLGGDGADILSGGNGDDHVMGDAGADTILAGDGDDMVLGGSGDDLIWGGKGHDVIDGGLGKDVIYASGGDGSDAINGGEDVDTVNFEAIEANLTIDLGADGIGFAVSSASGNDHLSGIENVKGGFGNDQITASNAHNVLDGGLGNDTFVFKSAVAADGDRIEGFQAGDKIDLRPLYGSLGLTAENVAHLDAGDASFNQAGGLKMHVVDGNTVIEGNTDGDLDIDFALIIAGHVVRGTDLA